MTVRQIVSNPEHLDNPTNEKLARVFTKELMHLKVKSEP
jgi:hypothetical protein